MSNPVVPWKLEAYSVWSHPPETDEELQYILFQTQKDCRVWREEPRGWSLEGFIGFQVSKAAMYYQLNPSQILWLRDRLLEEERKCGDGE